MSDISSIKRNSNQSIQLNNHSNINSSPPINLQNPSNIHGNNFLTVVHPQNFKVGQNNSFLRPLSSKNVNTQFDVSRNNNRSRSNVDEDFQLSMNIDESIRINDDQSDKLSLKLIHGQIENENGEFTPQDISLQNFDKNKNYQLQFQDYKNHRKHQRDFFSSRNQYLQTQQPNVLNQQSQNQQNERFPSAYNPTSHTNPIIQVFPSSAENSHRKQPLGKQIIPQPQQQQSLRIQTPINLAIALNSSKRIQNAVQHRRELSINTPSSGYNQSEAGRMLQSELAYNRNSYQPQLASNIHSTSVHHEQRERGLTSMLSPNEKNTLPIQSIVRTYDHNIANNPVQLISGSHPLQIPHRSSIFHTRTQLQREEITSEEPSERSAGLLDDNLQIVNQNNFNIHGQNNTNSSYSNLTKGSPNPNKRISFLKFSSQKLFLSRRESQRNGVGQQKIIQFQNPLSIVNLEDEEQDLDDEFNLLRSPKKGNLNSSNLGAASIKSPNESISKINIRKAVSQRQGSMPIEQENSLIATQQGISNSQQNQQVTQINLLTQAKIEGLPLQEIALQPSNQLQNTINFQSQDYVSPKSMFQKQQNGQKSNEKVGGFISQREGSGQNSNDGSFLKYLDPKQRETIFFVFRDRQQHQRYSERFSSFKNGNSWYEKLGLKAEKVKERLRQQNKLINHMIQRRNKFISDQIRILENIKKQKKLIQNQQSSEQDVKFEEEIQYDVELLKNQIEDLEDLYKEAQDLLTIFSVAIHKTDTSDLNLDPTINMFDFDSESLQVYSGFCEKLREIDSSIIEYKKYLKLDQDGEQFNVRTQNLMLVMKKCEEYEKFNEKKVNQLNLYLQNDISLRLDEIQVQIDINLQVQSNIQESADRVNKLLYIKKHQLRQVDRFIEDTSKKYELMIFSGSSTEDMKQLDALNTQIASEIRKLKDIKKETIEESSDHYSQYFLKLKQKISYRIFISLAEAKQRMESLQEINEYILTKILPIVQKKQDLQKENKSICQKMIKKSDFITEMSNNCIQLHATDTLQPFKQPSLLSISPQLNPSQSNINLPVKSKIQLNKVQSTPQQQLQQQQTPPPLQKQKTSVVKIDMIKEAAEQYDLIQQSKNDLKSEYQRSIELQAEMQDDVLSIITLHNKVGCFIPSLVSVQNSYEQEIEKLKSSQQQVFSNLRYDVFGNLKEQFQRYAQEELQSALKRGDQMIEEYLRSFEYYDAQIENLENAIEYMQENNLVVLQGHLDARKSLQENDTAKQEVLQYIRLIQSMITDLQIVVQFQTHLKFLTVGFSTINLLQDDLTVHFNKIEEIQTAYGELQKKSTSSSRYSLQNKCQQITYSITHILLFMKIFQKITFSKSNYILARQNLLNALDHIDENLTNVQNNFNQLMNHLDEEFLHLPKHFNASPQSTHKNVLRQQSFLKNNSFISEAPLSESASPSVQYLLSPNTQYNAEYNSNSKNAHLAPTGSYRKISSNFITTHNPANNANSNIISPPKNFNKALTFSVVSQQINRIGNPKSTNLIESFSEQAISDISDEEISSEKEVTFRTGNLEFKNNAHINVPLAQRYLKIDQNAERTDYQEDDDFLNSCVD